MTLSFRLLLILLLTTFAATAQKKNDFRAHYGIKGGYNFTNITNASSLDTKDNSGFMIGGFYATPRKGLIGYQSELIFSRQGYDFQTSSATGEVKMNYLILPQMMNINLGKLLKIQVGGQVAFLLNAKADSISSLSSTPLSSPKANDVFNRINYGFAAGLELNPVAGLVVGGRFNFFLASLNKDDQSFIPNYLPRNNEQLKTNLLQIYAGYRF
jgi:hypothetical protein